MNLFIISDIHGMYKQFEQLLTHWNPRDKLVLLGDLVDRGPQSLEVIRKVMALKAQYGKQVIVCMGNHDKMLLDFIASPLTEHSFYFQQGGRQTMKSFLKDTAPEVKRLNAIEQANYVQENFTAELDFLRSGELYVIAEQVLLTHAGFESSSGDLLESEDSDFLWIRDHYLRPNQTPYVNVFGHTPTRVIHDSDDIWVSEDQTYIGIDGGCAYEGQLNALLITSAGDIVESYSVDNGAAARNARIAAHNLSASTRTIEGILLDVQKKMALSDADMAARLAVGEHYWARLIKGQVFVSRTLHQKIYDTFFDDLCTEQKAYFQDYLKESETMLTMEEIQRLLKGESID